MPIVLFCGGGWYLVFGRPPDQQSGILGGPPPAKAAALPTKIIDPGAVLGGPVKTTNVLGTPTEKVAYVIPSNTPAPRVKCYARKDTQSPYSDTKILANGLFYADAFTRVNSGMIWSKQFGWYMASDFGCAPGLELLEVEFVQPPATATPKTPVVYPTRTRTPLPLPTSPAPTITPGPGIVLFDYFDCHNVQWLVWGASRVYLTVGTKRNGVPGDYGGQPVQQDLCSSLGQKIRLDVFMPSGQQLYREGVLQ